MYKFIKYSSNYSETTGSLFLYSKNNANNFNTDIANTNHFKPFKYKTKLLGNTKADNANGIFKKCNNCCAIKIFK